LTTQAADDLARKVLGFWFEEAGRSKWFARNDAFDAEVRARFEDAAIMAAAGLKIEGRHDWQERPETALALTLMLDQFPRNMYRGTKAAYAWDDLALMVARGAVARGFDLKMPMDRRSFFYMPYMHAENLAAQDECVRLVESRLESESTLFHARAHRELIKRFGRFPHRNEVLGRENTPEETEYLRSGGYTP